MTRCRGEGERHFPAETAWCFGKSRSRNPQATFDRHLSQSVRIGETEPKGYLCGERFLLKNLVYGIASNVAA